MNGPHVFPRASPAPRSRDSWTPSTQQPNAACLHHSSPVKDSGPRSAIPTILVSFALLLAAAGGQAGSAGATNLPAWMTRPLSLSDCLNAALEQSAEVLKGKRDLEANHGLSVQTRAVVIPKLVATGAYSLVEDSSVDRLTIAPGPETSGGFPLIDPGDQSWSAGIRLVQSIYEGGRMASSLRTARLMR